MKATPTQKEPTMTVATAVRQEALDLIADQAAGKITEEELLAGADQLELTQDELEVAQVAFDEHTEPDPQTDQDEPPAEPSKETVLADLKVLREGEKGSAKAALTRQIKKLEAELEAERQAGPARKVKYPEFELAAILASSRVHMESEPKDRRVYFANIDREPNEEGVKVKRSWAVVSDGEQRGVLSAVRTNGETRYRVRNADDASQNADLGVDKKAALQMVARKLNGVVYLGS